MKLRQIYLRQYGPLQKDLELADAINVIRGPNESGKTLLVEGLLKQLTAGSITNPVIETTPEGFVELSVNGGQYKIDDDNPFADYCEEHYNQAIRPEELRNVFVIRSGDLSFHNEDEFYTHITDKLTGRRVEDIEVIREALRKNGRLTKKNLNISSRQSHHDAGEQLEMAESLKSEIDDYLMDARADDIHDAETRYFTAKTKEEELETRIERLEAAKEAAEKRETYRSLQADKETIQENLEELDGLPDQSMLAEIDDRVQTLRAEQGHQDALEAQTETNITLAKWALGGGVATFGLSLVFGLPVVGVVAALLFVVACGYFWHQANQASTDLGELTAREQEIVSDARAAGLSFADKHEIRGEISDIAEQRETLLSDNQGKKAVLARELEFEADTMREVVSMAEEKLSEFEVRIDETVEVEYDSQAHESAKQELAEVKSTRQTLEETLEAHNKQLQRFRTAAAELNFSIFVGDPLDLEVENLDALETLSKRLNEFVAAIEDDAEASRTAIDIFDAIQAEEKEETAELFEEGSRASEIFHEITDGRYDRVTYDNDDNELQVVKSTGERFDPEELSEGTRDQLYLSIRVALGEEILDGQPGFFIMDDAFLTSDPDRLETQADVVEQLAEDGWQIVYLTSKPDAVSVLSARCDNDIIDLEPLK